MSVKLVMLAFVYVVGMIVMKVVRHVSPANRWFGVYTLTIISLTTIYFFITY